MKHKIYAVIICTLSIASLRAQTVSRLTGSPLTGATCPMQDVQYEVSVPRGFGGCTIGWSATNGKVTQKSGNTATVVWNDTPGATGTVTATFTACGSGNDNSGTSASLSELILSVKDQAWASYGNSINLDFCSKASIAIQVPRMFVQGTGGIAQPTLTEVSYAWTLPSGWKETGTGRTGFFGTAANIINIEPISCAIAGTVKVFGTLVGSGPFCNLSGQSATASIALISGPVATVTPQSGYTGSTACSTDPVIFYANTSTSSECIGSYDWTFPPSWSFVNQSGNSITLRPTGTPSDSAPIKAKVNFVCGSSVVSSNYVPPFLPPTIIGPGVVCSTGSYSIQNGSAVTAVWSSTDPTRLTMNSSTGEGTRLNNFTGPITVTAQLANCPSIPVPPLNIWLGAPITEVTINNQPTAFSYYPPEANDTPIYNSVCNGIETTTSTAFGGTSYLYWQRMAANPYNLGWTTNANGQNVIFYFWNVNQTSQFRLTASNVCGSTIKDYYFKSIDCSGGGGGCYQYSVSPNPSSTTMSVVVPNSPPPCGSSPMAVQTSESVIQTEAQPENLRSIQSLTLIDAQGQVKYSQQFSTVIKTVDIDVSKLKKGPYVLLISDGKYHENHRVLIH
jgi:hypothetical protein